MTQPRRAVDAALTLVEVLVVLAILGVATGAAVMGTGVLTRDTRVPDEARRLAALLQVAGDEALVNVQALQLDWTEGGYSFQRQRDDGDWGAAGDGRLARGHVLPGGLSLSRGDLGEGAVTLAPDGMGPPVALRLAGSGVTWTVTFDGIKALALPGQAAP